MSNPPVPITCPHHPECPGCPLLDLSYVEQLARKHAAVAAALAPYGLIEPGRLAPPRGAPTVTEYRLRAKLAVDATGLGLFAAGTHRVVDVPECRVLGPAVASAARALRALPLHQAGVSSVDLREVDRGVMVTLAAEGARAASVSELLTQVQQQVPALVSLALSERAPDAPQLLGRAPTVVTGAAAERHTPDPDAPYHYAGPGAFTQSHPAQLAALQRHVADTLAERLGGLGGRAVLELFAGSGSLGLRLSRAGARVVLVERFGPAIALAGRAAREQGLTLETHVADATEAVTRLAAGGARFDAVVLNPPRRGVSPELRRALARLAPRLVLYVSCEPVTLARDAAHLASLGFAMVEVTPYDMIPLSAAVEALAVFAPAPPPPLTVLHADAELIAVHKPPHLPVTPQGEHVGSLLERVRRELDAPEAAPVHRLDLGTSGVCLFARRPAAVAALAQALRAGEKSYTVLARGITRNKGILRRPLREHGRELAAVTRYHRRVVVGSHSLLEVRPATGHQHQIRRHLAGLGHPVVGDARHGDARTNQHFEHRHGLDRTFLHLAVLRLARETGPLELRSPLTPDLEAVLASLGRDAAR